MTRRDGDSTEQGERDRTNLEVGVVLVLFLIGTITLLTVLGPQTSRVLSVVSGSV